MLGKWLIAPVLALALIFDAPPAAADWLSAQLQPDGRYASASDLATPAQSTSEAIRALRMLGRVSETPPAEAFLSTEPYSGTEYLARRILAGIEAGIAVDPLVSQLAAHQNADGGFGELPGYSSSPLDTAFALMALAGSGPLQTSRNLAALQYLIGAQAAEGNWQAAPGDSSIYPTAWAVRALWPFRALLPGAVTAISRARDFLLAARGGNQLWGQDFESALSLLALLPLQSSASELAASTSALANRRDAEGSWARDVFTTALALQVLELASLPQANPDLGTITGRLVDGSTGASLAGATITLTGFASPSIEPTDEEGRFEFSSLAGGVYTLRIALEGFPELVSEMTLRAGQHVDLGMLSLLRTESATTARVQGLITDGDTLEPLSGVVVTVAGTPGAVTDAAGRFLLNAVPPGPVELAASKAGYFSARSDSTLVAGATVDFSVALSRVTSAGFHISGWFRDGMTLAPVPGVSVTVRGDVAAATTSDAYGRVLLVDLDPGAIEVTIAKTGYVSRVIVARAESGQTLDLSTILEPLPPDAPATFSLSGRVTNRSTGEPLSGAEINVTGSSAAEVATDADGRYRIDALVPGAIAVSASAPGFEAASAEATATASQSVEFSPELVPVGQHDNGLRGTVADRATGSKVAGAEVLVRMSANARTMITDAGGAFDLRNLSVGVAVVSVTAAGYRPAEFSVPIGTASFIDLGTLELLPENHDLSVKLEGVVVDAATSAAIGGATITVTGVSGIDRSSTGDDGRLVIEARSGETLGVEVEHPGHRPARLMIQAQAADTNLGQIRLQPQALSALFADLAIKSLDRSLAASDADTFAAGGELVVEVQNRGATSAPVGATVTAFIDSNGNTALDDADTKLGSAVSATAIPAGGSDSVRVPLSGALPFRDAPIAVMVDADRQIIELNESNNVSSTAAGCQSLPPPTSALDPALKWHWRGSPFLPDSISVYGPVVVGQLTDDDMNGVIDARDVPDLVFPTSLGALTVVSGDDGRTHWQTAPGVVAEFGSAAIGDIDGDGLNEIVAGNSARTRLLAFENDGSLKWNVPHGPTHSGSSRDGVALADLDGDGGVEIIIGRRVYTAAGTLLWEGTGDHGGAVNYGTLPIAVDLDGDGRMEVVAGRTAYTATGAVLWHQSGASSDGFTAVANLDPDSSPEIILVASGRAYALEHTGALKWGPVLLPMAGGRGGAPTVGDFDGDGQDEIGIAGMRYYTVLEHDGSIKWNAPIFDASAYTGSSLFDFDGDGRTEVVYSDEDNLYLFDGGSGQELIRIPNGSATVLDYPIVADVDGDGRAEIVVTSGGHGVLGVRVFEGGQAEWMPTRSIWNQSTYHVTNVGDDGSIPLRESPGWVQSSGYRQNAALLRALDLVPDLTAGRLRIVDHGTGQPPSLRIRIGNAGAPLPAGLATVAFHAGDPESGGAPLGALALPALDAGQHIDLDLPGVNLAHLSAMLVAIVDSNARVIECNEANNRTSVTSRPALGEITVHPDASAYPPGADIGIALSIHNTGSFPSNYTIALHLHDEQGTVVATLPGLETPTLAPGERVESGVLWNGGGVLAGEYRILAELRGPTGEVLGEGGATFAIRHPDATGPAVSLRMTTDRPVYHTTDKVDIDLLARNLTVSTLIANVELHITVDDSSGDAVSAQTLTLGDLVPGASARRNSSVRLEVAAEGHYTIRGVLRGAGAADLATGSSSFTVVEDLAASLVAAVTAGSPSVPAGRVQLCTETVRNVGSLDLGAQHFRHMLISLADAEIREEHGSTVSLPVGAAWTELLSVATTGLAPGDYACVLQARAGNEWRDLAHATFRVTPLPIRVTASLATGRFGRALILVDPIRNPKGEPDPFGPAMAPSLQIQREHMKAVLTAAGWSHTIVSSAEAFEAALCSGDYEVYAIFVEQLKLPEKLQHRIVAAVEAGAGLVVAGNHDSRNGRLEQALGIKTLGELSGATSLVLPASLVAAEAAEELSVPGRVKRIRLEGAAAVGFFRKGAAAVSPAEIAMTIHQHGRGRSLYLSLDLPLQGAAAGDDSLFGRLLVHALEYVHPPVLIPEAGHVLPLIVTLTNEGAATPGRVTVTGPPDVAVIDVGNVTSQSDGTPVSGGTVTRQKGALIWSYTLQEGMSAQLPLWIELPSIAGDLPIHVRVQVGSPPDLIDHGSSSHLIRVEAAR